jgi:glucokinase
MGDAVAQVIDRAGLTSHDLAGIGIGCTGPLDVERGLIMSPWTMPGWDEVPLGPALAERFGLPVRLDNDCNVAALGEHWIGAGRGAANMIYLTVSTGIGSGIIIDGKLRRGLGGNMGEVGLMSIDLDGPENEGITGAWEFLASGTALSQLAREQADAHLLDMAGGDPAQITAELVARLAAAGDLLALALIKREAFYLAVGVANLIVILAPEVVVMGGGVMKSWDLLYPHMEPIIRQRTQLIPTARQVRVVRTQLELAAGFLGGARLIFWDADTPSHL